MKQLLLKFQFAIGVFLLFSMGVQASDDDLITRQITVTLDEAGTLPDKIGYAKKNKITNLKIVGDINGTDVKFIREMAGSDYYCKPTDGKLMILDLSDAKIKNGGDAYCSYNGSNYIMRDNVIEDYFFMYCSSLTSVVLPFGVRGIKYMAFWGCNSLASIDIPSSVTSIGCAAFENCSSLMSIDIPSGVTSIESYAFNGCSSLASIAIPLGVTSIESFAFFGCSSLTSVVIPSGVTSIGEAAFWRCRSLMSVAIPSSVTSIWQSAFGGCSSLTSVVIPSSVTSIGKSAFSDCSSLSNVVISSSVTRIGSGAFSGCSSLTSVYVSSDSPASIGESAFSGFDKTACTLYVPQGTKDDYWLSSWGDEFDNIEEYDVTGMDHVVNSGEAKEVSRYSVDGKRLDAPVKGLNIVRYSDGSVKKIDVQ